MSAVSVEAVRRERDDLAARVQRVEEVLSAHGCDCDCGCDCDGHASDCDVCLACRIEREVGDLRRALRSGAARLSATEQRDEARAALRALFEGMRLDDGPRRRALEDAGRLLERWGAEALRGAP